MKSKVTKTVQITEIDWWMTPNMDHQEVFETWVEEVVLGQFANITINSGPLFDFADRETYHHLYQVGSYIVHVSASHQFVLPEADDCITQIRMFCEALEVFTAGRCAVTLSDPDQEDPYLFRTTLTTTRDFREVDF